MAELGQIEALLQRLPAEHRAPVVDAFRYALKQVRFGSVDIESAMASLNLGGALVPYETSSVADREVAVPHRLSRVPTLAIQVLALQVVNATSPTLVVTRAADDTYLYIKSATTDASGILYVE
ncbi:MAG: hypothetical protein ABL982_00065 [Vicinamibacterales bacterium]